ncbi:MAG: folylpolyglutamate synthase/dihydrofolate synthase family protein [Mycobacterium sp.]
MSDNDFPDDAYFAAAADDAADDAAEDDAAEDDDELQFPGDDDYLTPEAITEPTPDEVAALLQVEHLLDQRWPETKIEPSTTRITALMELLGTPQLAYPAIHIAGTNGKTSVARMVDALVTAFHQRTGRTTSPHLQSAVERISIDGKPITPARYVEIYREIEPFVELIDQQSQAAGGPAMSKFEVVTAMAFAAFADAPVDVAIVEVGLGGRWDATNIVNAPVAVITPIGVDHVEYLGSDIAGIAGEKAGIIGKPKVDDVVPEGIDPSMVAIIAQQVPEAMDVIMAQVLQADASVAREESEFRVLSRQVAVGGQLLDLQGLGGVYPEIFVPLHGEHQAHNAVVALAAVEAFFGAGASKQLDVDAVRAGFAAVTSPGRLERMRSAPTVFIDAAHNPAGAAALAQSLTDEFDFKFLVGVIAVMADKDVPGILAALEPVFDHVVVTQNGSPRALEVEALALLAEERFGQERVITAATLADAVETATALVEDAGEDTGLSGNGIVITGSVVTAGVARTLFGKDPQ